MRQEVTNLFRMIFRVAFPDRNPPSKSTIQYNVRKYQQDGTSLNVNKERSGRRREARTPENIERVRELLGDQQRRVTCRRNTLGITKSTFNLITRLDLK